MDGERSRVRPSIFVLLVWLLIGVMSKGCTPSPPQSYTPTSGKKYKVNHVTPMFVAVGQKALFMTCEADTVITNSVELRKDVEEIWTDFKKSVEKAMLTNALIQIVHIEGRGLFAQSQDYRFDFVKRTNGNWYCIQDEQK